MVRILYEHPVEWPKDGTLSLDTQLQLKAELAVSPDSARRCANGYLGLNVAMVIQADDPMLVLAQRPVWRLQVNLRIRGLGQVANLGTLDVDAKTRAVIPLSEEEITNMRTRANAIALSLTSTTTPAG